ncbi:MAG TPA: hypothetical protein VFJ81_10455 [Gemmatimonadales bacterium]|nr:hypothetical protein [Gemmatimonadales bacterium]
MTTVAASPAHQRWRVAPVIGLVGLALSGIGILVDPRQAYASWLAALAAGLSVTLGALLLVAIASISGARWFDPLRGFALDVAGTLPLFALLFLVLLPGLGVLYPWVDARGLPNAAWLNRPWFLVRAAFYFAVWIGIALTLRRWALPGADLAAPPAPRERALAGAALPPLGLTLTFAAFDWLMSLDPRWTSTVFGVYWFAGGFLAALAVVTLAAARTGDERAHPARLPASQGYALGALMVTFAVFWGYIAYSQYFIIWIADVPAEVAWYVPRVRGGWGVLALAVLVGQLALPFLVLLLYAAKRSARAMAMIAAWLLVVHYLDTYWLVLPAIHPDAPHPHWLDLSALAAVAGCAAAWIGWLGRRGPRITGTPHAQR